MEAIKRFWTDEEGTSAVEYGILLALIAAVLVTAVTALSTAISGKMTDVATIIKPAE